MRPRIDRTEIDKLVDGELGPAERRDLLLRLETSPDGWRLCALAFLEARELSEVARGWAGEFRTEPLRVVSLRRDRQTPRLALAVMIIGLAFLVGFATRGMAPSRVRPTGPTPMVVSSRTIPTPNSPSSTPILAVDNPENEPSPPPKLPDYVRVQWARLGYQVEPARRVISVEEDGRRESFPVDGYRVEYVGRPTY